MRTSMIGTTLGHFKVVAKLAESASDEVYGAEDEALRRPVVLRILSPALASDPEHKERFLKAARAAALVMHPHVAAVHEVGESEGRVWVAMEVVEGPSLRSRLAGRPLPLLETLKVGEQVAEGLAAAHERSLAHGDLRPEKVMLGPGGQVKVVGLGLSDREGGEAYDTRTDVYRLGAMLYEMTTGRPLGPASGVDASSAAPTVPPSTLNPETPPELDRIINACLEADPQDRYQHAGQLAVDLGKLRRRTETAELAVPSGDTVAGPGARRNTARRWIWRAVSLALVAALGLAGWRWVWPRVRPGPPFKKGDRIMQTDFVNETGDPRFDTFISEYFEQSLPNSFLHFLPGDWTSRTGVVDRAAAERRCRAGECEGNVTGRITRGGTGLRFEVALYRAGSSEPTTQQSGGVPDEPGLFAALDRAAYDIVRQAARKSGVPEPRLPLQFREECPIGLYGSVEYMQAVLRGFYSIDEMKHAIELNPNAPFPRYRQAIMLSAGHSSREARTHMKEALRMVSALVEQHPDCRRSQLECQIRLMGMSYDYDRMWELMTPYTHLWPEDWIIQVKMGELVQGDFEDLPGAEKYFRKAFERDVNAVTSLLINLAAQGKVEEFDSVMEQYQERTGDKDPLPGFRIRQAWGRGDDYGKIVALSDRFHAEKAYSEGTAREFATTFLLFAGRLNEAEQRIDEVEKTDQARAMRAGEKMLPPRTYYLPAWLEKRRTGIPPPMEREHIAALKAMMNQLPDLAEWSVELGLTHPLKELLRHHEQEEADNLNRTVRKWLQLGYGCLALVEGRAEQAVAMLELLARESNRQLLQHVLGRAYEADGRWEDAAKAYEVELKSLRRSVIFETGLVLYILDQHRLAGIYERLGNSERARYWYGRFLNDWKDADAGTPEVEEAKRRLAALGGPLPAGS